MKISFIKDCALFGAYKGSEYNIHDSHTIGDKTYYVFDVGDGRPPFSVTIGNIKGYAVISSGEAEDIYDRIAKEYAEKGEEDGNETTSDEQSDQDDAQDI